MICPKCEDKGLTSKVYGGTTVSTLVAAISYFDEGGRHHYHDPNSYTTFYHCTNNHNFFETEYRSCWCGWSGKK